MKARLEWITLLLEQKFLALKKIVEYLYNTSTFIHYRKAYIMLFSHFHNPITTEWNKVIHFGMHN